MSILINGMKMPKSCRACRFSGFGGRRCELNVCMFTGESQPTLSQERMSNCPLVPVPPHGRLIDADAMEKEVCGGCVHGEHKYLNCIDCALANAPTIIPAEEGEA